MRISQKSCFSEIFQDYFYNKRIFKNNENDLKRVPRVCQCCNSFWLESITHLCLDELSVSKMWHNFSRDVILSQLQGHQGQKGQKGQKVGNALKHMQNIFFCKIPQVSVFMYFVLSKSQCRSVLGPRKIAVELHIFENS